MLDTQKCCLVIVDVQGKLAQLMYDRDGLFKNIQILIKAAKILDIPIVWCQQCPAVLGVTVPEIAELLSDHEPINKSTFSCCRSEIQEVSSLNQAVFFLSFVSVLVLSADFGSLVFFSVFFLAVSVSGLPFSPFSPLL